MIIQKTKLKDLIVIQPNIYEDNRGYFYESFNSMKFNETIGYNVEFVQDNQSYSHKGTLRGMHFQNPPFAQGKLVRVISGKVIDVAVDLRKTSPTYGQYFSIELSGQNNNMMWIPEGFAHGFYVLEDNTIFSYKCTNYFNKESEDSILWNDKTLNINWQIEKIEELLISEKDNIAKSFKDFESKF